MVNLSGYDNVPGVSLFQSVLIAILLFMLMIWREELKSSHFIALTQEMI